MLTTFLLFLIKDFVFFGDVVFVSEIVIRLPVGNYSYLVTSLCVPMIDDLNYDKEPLRGKPCYRKSIGLVTLFVVSIVLPSVTECTALTL